nr:ORF1 [Torque teno arctocephalus australis virus 1]
MAYYWRRRFPRYRRRGFRRRRGFYRRRAYFRGRYNRRGRVRRRRRRRFRRSFYRRRPTKRVITWNPPRVVKCRIRGWDYGLWTDKTYITYPFESIYKPTGNPAYQVFRGGGVSIRTYNLNYFYQANKFHRNIWSYSNEGFDLAAYSGTKLTFYRKSNISYIVWWESEFGDPNPTHYQSLHPARALLKKRKLIMLSKEAGGKKKRKIFIRPPSTQENKWYNQSSWCNVNLFKLGITTINFENCFIHNGQRTNGTWIGFYSITFGPASKVYYTQQSFDNFLYYAMYRPYWDNGEGNMILVNKRHVAFNEGQTSELTVEKISIPYYEYFYGYGGLVGVPFKDGIAETPEARPNVVGILWYADPGYIFAQNQPPITNRHIQDPSQLQVKGKVWILLSDRTKGHPSTFTWPAMTPTTKDQELQLPTVTTVGKILTAMASTSPFALHNLDIDPNVPMNISIPFTYTSYWKWGGAPYTPKDAIDPCDTDTPGGRDYRGVQIRDPYTVATHNIHPFDLDSKGILTKEGLQRLISGIFDAGPPPQQPREDGEIQKEKGSESGEEDEQELSDSDSYSSAVTSRTSSSETEEEETEQKQVPAKILRRLQQLRKRVDNQQQQRRLIKRRLRRLLI